MRKFLRRFEERQQSDLPQALADSELPLVNDALTAPSSRLLLKQRDMTHISTCFDEILANAVSKRAGSIRIEDLIEQFELLPNGIAYHALCIFGHSPKKGEIHLNVEEFSRMAWAYCPQFHDDEYFYSFALPFGIEDESHLTKEHEIEHMKKEYQAIFGFLEDWKFPQKKMKTLQEVGDLKKIPDEMLPENFSDMKFHKIAASFVHKHHRMFYSAFSFQETLQERIGGQIFWKSVAGRFKTEAQKEEYCRWRLEHIMEHFMRWKKQFPEVLKERMMVPWKAEFEYVEEHEEDLQEELGHLLEPLEKMLHPLERVFSFNKSGSLDSNEQGKRESKNAAASKHASGHFFFLKVLTWWPFGRREPATKVLVCPPSNEMENRSQSDKRKHKRRSAKPHHQENKKSIYRNSPNNSSPIESGRTAGSNSTNSSKHRNKLDQEKVNMKLVTQSPDSLSSSQSRKSYHKTRHHNDHSKQTESKKIEQQIITHHISTIESPTITPKILTTSGKCLLPNQNNVHQSKTVSHEHTTKVEEGKLRTLSSHDWISTVHRESPNSFSRKKPTNAPLNFHQGHDHKSFQRDQNHHTAESKIGPGRRHSFHHQRRNSLSREYHRGAKVSRSAANSQHGSPRNNHHHSHFSSSPVDGVSPQQPSKSQGKTWRGKHHSSNYHHQNYEDHRSKQGIWQKSKPGQSVHHESKEDYHTPSKRPSTHQHKGARDDSHALRRRASKASHHDDIEVVDNEHRMERRDSHPPHHHFQTGTGGDSHHGLKKENFHSSHNN